jgi:hypothetical protein
MNSHMPLRFAGAGIVLALTAATPQPKPVLIDCQVIPVWCKPDDVCAAVRSTIQQSDEYHFALSKTGNPETYSGSSATYTTTITTTATKTATKTETRKETTVSASTKTSKSSTGSTGTTTRNTEVTMEKTVKPTPTPPGKAPTVTVTKKITRTGANTTSAPAGKGQIFMLDAPHDIPSDQVTWKWLPADLTSSQNALTWSSPSTLYATTRFVLWRDTLRLDVITSAQRSLTDQTVHDMKVKTPPKDGFYGVTILWRGACSQPTTQLP